MEGGGVMGVEALIRSQTPCVSPVVSTLEVFPEACVPRQVTHPADLVPGLVGEPAGGRVRHLVLQPNSTSEEEHELFTLQFTLGSVGGRVEGEGREGSMWRRGRGRGGEEEDSEGRGREMQCQKGEGE